MSARPTIERTAAAMLNERSFNIGRTAAAMLNERSFNIERTAAAMLNERSFNIGRTAELRKSGQQLPACYERSFNLLPAVK